MRLIIAEKPSVARAIAGVLPGPWLEEEGFLRGQKDIVSWSVGHLLTLKDPDEYDKKYKRWQKDSLPIMPGKLEVKPAPGRGQKQLKILHRLIHSKEVKTIVNACDAGREGELIFAWIMESSLSSKSVERLWLRTLQKEDITKAFSDLRPGSQYLNLEQAARARAEADWLLGMNATRAATLSLGAPTIDGVLSVGRVQTPTLALLVKREIEIQNFTPEKFWTVGALFDFSVGSFAGEHEAGRVDQKRAEEIAKSCSRGEGKVIEVKEKSGVEKPPLLHDLTSLQRQASSSWSWSAKRTLSVAQNLYEREKIISYPRTDSKYLSSSMKKDLQALFPLAPAPYQPFSREAQVTNSPHLFDDKKVRDHHAIIPLGHKELSGDEGKLFDLIWKRTLAAFSREAEYSTLRVITRIAEEDFVSKGKTYTDLGWRAFYPGETKAETLPPLKKDMQGPASVTSREGETKPPPRFSDGKLLGAMESLGGDMDDEKSVEAMRDKGLGTPATRASIIERLIAVDYLERDGRVLRPTEKGIYLIGALEGSDLISAELTGEWEKSLLLLERGEKEPLSFDRSIRKWVETQTKEIATLSPPKAPESDWGKCPECGNDLLENRKAISCWRKDDPGCGFALWKKKAGKTLARGVIRELLETKKTEKPVQGFSGRSGKKFAARLCLEKKGQKWDLVFDEDWARDNQKPFEKSSKKEGPSKK